MNSCPRCGVCHPDAPDICAACQKTRIKETSKIFSEVAAEVVRSMPETGVCPACHRPIKPTPLTPDDKQQRLEKQRRLRDDVFGH